MEVAAVLLMHAINFVEDYLSQSLKPAYQQNQGFREAERDFCQFLGLCRFSTDYMQLVSHNNNNNKMCI